MPGETVAIIVQGIRSGQPGLFLATQESCVSVECRPTGHGVLGFQLPYPERLFASLVKWQNQSGLVPRPGRGFSVPRFERG